MSYKTAMGRVIGLGSAKTGGEHWFGERLKAVALVPLTIGFIVVIAPLIGEDYKTVTKTLSHPLCALTVIAFLLVTFKHLEEGLQVVIEDYVHAKGWLITLLVLSKLGTWALGLGGVFAVAKIAFGG